MANDNSKKFMITTKDIITYLVIGGAVVAFFVRVALIENQVEANSKQLNEHSLELIDYKLNDMDKKINDMNGKVDRILIKINEL